METMAPIIQVSVHRIPAFGTGRDPAGLWRTLRFSNLHMGVLAISKLHSKTLVLNRIATPQINDLELAMVFCSLSSCSFPFPAGLLGLVTQRPSLT